MHIRIYQIDPDKDMKRIAFTSYKFAEQRGIDPSIYKKVFEGTIPDTSLEDIYILFNEHNIPGFIGHSLSMSDIIEIVKADGTSQCHFCDRLGYKTFDFDTSNCAEYDYNEGIKRIAKVQEDNYNPDSPCPRCGGRMREKLIYNSLSRYADIYVCETCGANEALSVMLGKNTPLNQWACFR